MLILSFHFHILPFLTMCVVRRIWSIYIASSAIEVFICIVLYISNVKNQSDTK